MAAMHLASRTKAIAFFITLGACLVGLAIALNVSWIILNWRETVALVLGIIFFGVIIAGLVLNTIFLVREIRRNEQQDSFLNAVTHELKTPIASIRLYLETLQQRNVEEDKRREFYRIMLDDTDRLLGTVEQVLKAGEVRDGARKGWREVDFAVIVADAVELARVRHGLSTEALRFRNHPSSETTVLGNPEQLRIAVTNLLDNAVKYSGPTKDIEVRLETPNIDDVVLNVQDHGIGLPRPELKRVFKRFYRVHAAAAGQVKGTGLGLFIVRSVARRHGGDAYAQSEGEGHGSTFIIRLPRVYHVGS
jgi:two-component system, OmpR family, sensor histidine kinase SenX3